MWFLTALDEEETDEGQAIICTGIAKLLLAGMVNDQRALEALVIVYFSPQTAHNHELRQCLSYFFPMYCGSWSANQERMRKVGFLGPLCRAESLRMIWQSFINVFTNLSETYREWDGDEDMTSPAQICAMIGDWTDPQRAL